MSNLSRRDSLKGALASAATAVVSGALGTGVTAFAESASGMTYKAGTYESIQSTDFATIKVTCTFSETALTDVSYELVETSDNDFFATKAAEMKDYCARIKAAGSLEGVDRGMCVRRCVP